MIAATFIVLGYLWSAAASFVLVFVGVGLICLAIHERREFRRNAMLEARRIHPSNQFRYRTGERV